MIGSDMEESAHPLESLPGYSFWPSLFSRAPCYLSVHPVCSESFHVCQPFIQHPFSTSHCYVCILPSVPLNKIQSSKDQRCYFFVKFTSFLHHFLVCLSVIPNKRMREKSIWNFIHLSMKLAPTHSEVLCASLIPHLMLEDVQKLVHFASF